MVSKPHLRVLCGRCLLGPLDLVFVLVVLNAQHYFIPKCGSFEFPEARIGINIVLTLGSQIYTYYDVL